MPGPKRSWLRNEQQVQHPIRSLEDRGWQPDHASAKALRQRHDEHPHPDVQPLHPWDACARLAGKSVYASFTPPRPAQTFDHCRHGFLAIEKARASKAAVASSLSSSCRACVRGLIAETCPLSPNASIAARRTSGSPRFLGPLRESVGQHRHGEHLSLSGRPWPNHFRPNRERREQRQRTWLAGTRKSLHGDNPHLHGSSWSAT